MQRFYLVELPACEPACLSWGVKDNRLLLLAVCVILIKYMKETGAWHWSCHNNNADYSRTGAHSNKTNENAKAKAKTYIGACVTQFILIITARLAKRVKVMFSQAFVCPSPGEGGVATPNASGQHLPPSPPRTWTWDLVTTPPSPPPDMEPGHNTPLPPDMDMGPGHNTPLPPNMDMGPGHNTPPPQTWTWDLVSTPPPPQTMRRRAVRILLECILVGIICKWIF